MVGAMAAMAGALCTACAVGPNYKAPQAEQSGTPEQWHAQLPHDGTVGELDQWWQQFNDPLMTRMIASAEAHNPSIDAAVGAVRAARASVTDARSSFFPKFTGTASATRNADDSSSSTASPYNLLTGSIDASWELDLFGGVRRSQQAAVAKAQGAEADWNEARVSLAAEVADTYVQRRYCERLVRLYDDTYKSLDETRKLTDFKLKAGFVAPADAAEARAAAYDAQNQLIAQKGECAQQVNALVALTGMTPQQIEQALKDSAGTDIPVPQSPVVPAIPAKVISQRPDVMSSERSLAAASANIGVADASRLPSLTLLGNISFNRLPEADVNARSWYWGPSLSLPIFEGGAGRARSETARAQYDQALASYHSTVLTAVQEVEDALVRIDTAVQREGSASLSEQNYSELLKSQENRYNQGAASMLDLEVSRRLTLTSRESLASVQLEISRAWIALYKAAGGGWQTMPQNLEPSQAPADDAAAPATTTESSSSHAAPAASGAGA